MARGPAWLRHPVTARAAVDVAAVAGLIAVAYREQASRFRSGAYLDLGGPGDWIAHAHRSQLAAAFGLTSWDPAWDRGYPNVDGWQEVPDLLTGAASRLLHLPIPRTMVVLTLLCLLAYPVAGYVALRLLRCGPLAALLGGALLLDNPAMYAFVDDYSGIFGLAALPLAVWVVLDQFGRRGGWPGALLVGLLVELHPFAAVAAVALVAARLLHDRGRDLLVVLGQCAVALAAGAPYWLTFLSSARPRAADTGFEASTVFADSHLFLRVGLVELSAGALLLLGAALVALAARRLPHRRQSVCCLGAAALMGAAVALSYRGWMPKPVMEAQLTRSMPFVAVLLAMGLAPLGDLIPDAVGRLVSVRREAAVGVAAIAVLVVGALLVRDGAHWTAENLAPVADDAYPTGHDVAAWVASHPAMPRPLVFWAPYDVAAAGSYDAGADVEFTSDYTARSWSVANTQINALITGGAPFAAVEPYLRAEGVAYLYVPDGRPEAATLDAWLAAGSVLLLDRGRAGRVAGVPGASPAAFSAPAAMVRAGTLPDLAFYTDPAANAELDRDMRRWSAVTTSATAVAAATVVTSPSGRRLTVAGRRGDVLVVGQRWDAGWSATVDGRSLRTERVGPGLLGVDLDADGTQTVVVEHGASIGERLALLLLALAAAGSVAALVVEHRRRRFRR